MQLEKSQFQLYLQLEKMSGSTWVATKIKFQLRLDLQLKKNLSCDLICNWKYLSFNSTCNWEKISGATRLATRMKISVAAWLATRKKLNYDSTCDLKISVAKLTWFESCILNSLYLLMYVCADYSYELTKWTKLCLDWKIKLLVPRPGAQ
jgi:hypothetical protein